MNEQTNTTSAAFMEVTSRKVAEQDQRIAVVEEKINEATLSSGLIRKLSEDVSGLRTDLKSVPLLPGKMDQLSTQLEKTVQRLQHPASQKIMHHHYVPKMIWISAGLFIVLCLVCSAWYVTSSKLDNFIANDTKYRQLRLDTAHKSLQLYLDQLDSLYTLHDDLRERVLAAEDERRLNFERLKKAERLKTEAKNLEKAAGKK